MKRKMKKSILITVVLILLVLLGACKPEEQKKTEPPKIPAPKEGLCVVSGQIVSEKTGKAPRNAVYLALNITADKDNLPDYLSFSHMSSPRAIVDENGYFYIEDVEEGQYAILLFEPGGNHHFVDNGKTDDTKDYLWVNAVPNETLDMGKIVVP